MCCAGKNRSVGCHPRPLGINAAWWCDETHLLQMVRDPVLMQAAALSLWHPGPQAVLWVPPLLRVLRRQQLLCPHRPRQLPQQASPPLRHPVQPQRAASPCLPGCPVSSSSTNCRRHQTLSRQQESTECHTIAAAEAAEEDASCVRIRRKRNSVAAGRICHFAQKTTNSLR